MASAPPNIPNAPADAFVWGAGGRRLTPEEVEQQRKVAESLMAPDYSPIVSPWQGLARVAGNLRGALEERDADKAAAANAADTQASIASMLNPSSPLAPVPSADFSTSAAPSAAPAQQTINPAVAAAIASPYVDPSVKKFAMAQWERANPKPQAATDLQRNYEWLSGMGRAGDANDLIAHATQADPFISTVLPGGQFYAGPQSGLGAFLQGGAAAPAFAPNGPAVGTVEDGYVFMGGDPANQANWRKQ